MRKNIIVIQTNIKMTKRAFLLDSERNYYWTEPPRLFLRNHSSFRTNRRRLALPLLQDHWQRAPLPDTVASSLLLSRHRASPVHTASTATSTRIRGLLWEITILFINNIFCNWCCERKQSNNCQSGAFSHDTSISFYARLAGWPQWTILGADSPNRSNRALGGG